MARIKSGVGGWLLLLCALLLIWEPVNLALQASGALVSLPVRGLPLGLLLVARVIVAALGMAAGMALLGRRGHAVGLAKTALVASALMDLFVYTTPYFPSNRMPGDTPLFIAASLAFHGAWLLYLFRSSRVRETY